MLNQSSQGHSNNIPSDKENGNNPAESSNGNAHNAATCVVKNRDINDKGNLNFFAHYYDQCFRFLFLLFFYFKIRKLTWLRGIVRNMLFDAMVFHGQQLSEKLWIFLQQLRSWTVKKVFISSLKIIVIALMMHILKLHLSKISNESRNMTMCISVSMEAVVITSKVVFLILLSNSTFTSHLCLLYISSIWSKPGRFSEYDWKWKWSKCFICHWTTTLLHKSWHI